MENNTASVENASKYVERLFDKSMLGGAKQAKREKSSFFYEYFFIIGIDSSSLNTDSQNLSFPPKILYSHIP